ncbi:class I SAM-dependent methyltransferase [Methylobacterium hispanicum]|uniref:class I SAM-dependent methyltransferase n=1 Tax=Methylobacterium hispanicum TaxID=270350 RepID=UPI002F30DD71
MNQSYDEAAAKEDVMQCLQLLRRKLNFYWRHTGKPPKFILEGDVPAINEDAVRNCKVFADRFSMLKNLASGSTAAELGTQHGNLAKFMLDNLGVYELHLFDLKFDITRDDVKNHPSVRLHQGDSAAGLNKMPDEYFDWIYIDAGHSYANVKSDTIAAMKKLKRGGLLFYNDYTPWSAVEGIPYGVMKAVNETINGGWSMAAFALAPGGYFDVAIQRA